MIHYPKFNQGEPVRIKASKEEYEVSHFDAMKQEYLILKLDKNGFRQESRNITEDELEQIRGNEYQKYIFNFNAEELRFLKNHFAKAEDKEDIIINLDDLDFDDKILLRAILRKLERRRDSKHGRDSAKRGEYQMLHNFFRQYEDEANIYSFDWHRVRDVLSVHELYP